MRITNIIAGLGGGGAERVCINLANAWAERGFAVTILTVAQGTGPPAYTVDRRVRRRDITGRRAGPEELTLDSITPILRALYGVACFEIIGEMPVLAILRHAILATAPDVVVAHIDLTNVRVLAAMHETGIPVIACEQTDVRRFTIGSWQDTREALYRRARAVVAPHPTIAAWLAHRGARAYAIPNLLWPPPTIGIERGQEERRRLVTLARLSPEKRVDLIVHAFAKIAGDFPEWDLDVYGEGPLRDSIAKLIDELAPGRVRLRGFTNHPYDVLRGADLFVSASWLEGFGNAIWEALACGVPVVALEAGPAVRSLVRDGIDGLIVSGAGPEALSAALASLMWNEPARKALASRAREVLERFSVDDALRKWDALLEEVLSRGRVHALA
jgi:GalNAc-alpha-(1->4)-GalNAc-alpha-(1->3)-diNAcBac-PP-undecaprenol alpha-1,4-N-acetyl-D-galactosaminyltransferase